MNAAARFLSMHVPTTSSARGIGPDGHYSERHCCCGFEAVVHDAEVAGRDPDMIMNAKLGAHVAEMLRQVGLDYEAGRSDAEYDAEEVDS